MLHLFHAEIAPEEAEQQLSQQSQTANGNVHYEHETLAGADAIAAGGRGRGGRDGRSVGSGRRAQTVQAEPHEKLGRNDPCWCGSGKKFKKCHGA